MAVVKPTYDRPGDDDFYKKLRKEVQETVLDNPGLQNLIVYKALGLVLAYFIFYFCILFFGNNTYLLFLFYILMGYSMIFVFVNTFHDAVHNCVFKKNKYNRWYMKTMDLFGGNSYIWSKRHNLLHHPYPNIQDWDIDVKQSNMARIFPNSPLFWFNKYQHIYMFFMYPFYTLFMIFVRDFRDAFGTKNNLLKRVHKVPKKEQYRLIIYKILYLTYIIAIPALVLDQPFWMILLAWFVMHLTASMVGVVALVSTHAHEHAIFPEMPEDGKMHTTWAKHQIVVTKDFSADSAVFSFLYGGFTHHVAHHLFPTVPHTYYPKITKIIKKYAKEYDLPYLSLPVFEAIWSHFLLLKKNGYDESIFRSTEF